MLSVNRYQKEYVAECRSRMKAQLVAYRALALAARSDEPAANPAAGVFEPLFLNNLIVVMDGFFIQRNRALEQADGNPLNEVRMLCHSILQDRGVLSADRSMQYNPAKSVLKFQIGERIKLAEADFVRLFEAFFAGIEAKYT